MKVDMNFLRISGNVLSRPQMKGTSVHRQRVLQMNKIFKGPV